MSAESEAGRSVVRAWRQFLEEHASRISELRYSLFLFRKNVLAVLGLVLIIVVIALAFLAPYLSLQQPQYANIGGDLQQRWTTHDSCFQAPFDCQIFLAPSLQHPFGTDNFGVDWYSKVLYGAGISLEVGILVVVPVAIIGSLLGLLAGYKGGIVEEVIMRVTDIFLSIPSLILAIAITAVLGRSLVHVMYALIITWWPWYTRLVRGQVLSVKERQFIESARSVGASPGRLMLRHILPNSISPVVVQASMDFGYVILTAAGLGFLGLGAPPGTAEWGVMISEGITYLFSAPWMSIFPGLAIMLTVLGFNLLGDGLRDILDPRLRR
ncbi:MAG TPA: ABC transporter permease [Thermoplasmata archaeon]|nr:ABC transporter permease [Thermoplasmata archaeon]